MFISAEVCSKTGLAAGCDLNDLLLFSMSKLAGNENAEEMAETSVKTQMFPHSSESTTVMTQKESSTRQDRKLVGLV